MWDQICFRASTTNLLISIHWVLSSFLLINKYRFLVFRQLINFLRIFRWQVQTSVGTSCFVQILAPTAPRLPCRAVESGSGPGNSYPICNRCFIIIANKYTVCLVFFDEIHSRTGLSSFYRSSGNGLTLKYHFSFSPYMPSQINRSAPSAQSTIRSTGRLSVQ